MPLLNVRQICTDIVEDSAVLSLRCNEFTWFVHHSTRQMHRIPDAVHRLPRVGNHCISTELWAGLTTAGSSLNKNAENTAFSRFAQLSDLATVVHRQPMRTKKPRVVCDR